MDPKTLDSLKEACLAAGVVSAVAVAIAVPMGIAFRISGKPFRTPWPFPGIPWRTAGILLAMFPLGLIGFHINVAFIAQHLPFDGPVVGVSPEGLAQLRLLGPTILAMPAFVAFFVGLRWLLKVTAEQNLLRDVLLGLVAWAVLMPLTFTVHFAVLQTFQALGIPEVQHPLTNLKPQSDGFGGVLFGLSVCVCTPIVEECLFRGLLVPWAAQKKIYPWILMFAAMLMAGISGESKFGPVAFVFILATMLLAVATVAPRPRFPRRTLAAILSSSALFAAAHSAVWPTPIPLFVLACGLGWLTARTRSVVPAIVVHGLFNAVSFVMLCRGSSL